MAGSGPADAQCAGVHGVRPLLHVRGPRHRPGPHGPRLAVSLRAGRPRLAAALPRPPAAAGAPPPPRPGLEPRPRPQGVPQPPGDHHLHLPRHGGSLPGGGHQTRGWDTWHVAARDDTRVLCCSGLRVGPQQRGLLHGRAPRHRRGRAHPPDGRGGRLPGHAGRRLALRPPRHQPRQPQQTLAAGRRHGASHVTRHTSHSTQHVSRVTRHT